MDGSAVPEFVQQAAASLEAEQEQASMAAAGDASLSALAEQLVGLREVLESMEEERKNIQAQYDQLRKVTIPEAMRRAGLVAGNRGSFTAAGGKVHLETRVFAGYDRAHQQEFFSWLDENGLGELVKPTINAQTLSATVRERREEGLSDPPFVSVHEEVTAKFVKSRK